MRPNIHWNWIILCTLDPDVLNWCDCLMNILEQLKLRNQLCYLTHWGRVTHICVGNLTIIGSDNGLSPGRRQAIIWTNAGILLIRTLGTNLSEILGEIHSFSFSKMHLKMSSAKWRLFGLGLNELMGNYNIDLLILLFPHPIFQIWCSQMVLCLWTISLSELLRNQQQLTKAYLQIIIVRINKWEEC